MIKLKETISSMFLFSGMLFIFVMMGYGVLSGGNYLVKGYFLDTQFNHWIGMNYYNDITGLIGLDNLIKDFIIFAPFWQGSMIIGGILFFIGYVINADNF